VENCEIHLLSGKTKIPMIRNNEIGEIKIIKNFKNPPNPFN